ncbi:MAG: S-layer homology domain-containing protein [Oscillospiraceae bacterium]
MWTREQAATFLYRYATNVLGFWFTLRVTCPAIPSGDRISEFAAEAVLWATDAGIFEGFPDGTFQPQGALTRAQLAKILTVLNRYAASYSPY